MYRVKSINKIAPVGIARMPADKFKQDNDSEKPDVILVRSASLHEAVLPDNLLCIARAGAGVNNIPIEKCSEKGVVVFNTPGANANAVRELTLCAMLLASRDIVEGVCWARSLTGEDISAQVEKGKSQFAGPEIMGKTLGVIGLGAIGVGVANAAHHLGMDVLGYDPYISVDSAWGLSRSVHRAMDIKQIFAECEYITIHVPQNKETQNSLKDMLSQVRPGVRIINLSRGGLIDSNAMLTALDSNIVSRYVTDFPSKELLNHPKVVPIPHLGASTPESEDNCAIMAVDQAREYVQFGNIKNSVNMPDVELPYLPGYRICVIHRNVPHMLSGISSAMASSGINIENMINKSKKDYAYTLLDVSSLPGDNVLRQLKDISGILRVRVLKI